VTVAILGGINLDIVMQVAALPLPGETITARRVVEGAGGKGLNQAVAAARFGASVQMLGAVGDDEAGRSLRALLREDGIDESGVATCLDSATGRAFIALSEDGENSIVVDAGANMTFGAEALRAATAPVRVSLTQFEARPDAIEAMFLSPGAGIRILNAAPALVDHRALLALADIAILNETECQAFAGAATMPHDAQGIAALARQLLGGQLRHIIVTLGGQGCLLVDAEGHEAFAAIKVPVVNTVGAGDCFCGVFAAALAQGLDMRAAIRFAGAAAALAVGREGAAEACPYRHEVDDLLAAA